MKNKHLNRFVAAMPHNTYAMFAAMDIIMALLITVDQENAKQLNKARETLRSAGRLATQVQAVWFAELITMISMIVYNQVDTESHFRAGLVVYPAMMLGIIYNALQMDRINKKHKIFKQQMDAVYHKQK